MIDYVLAAITRDLVWLVLRGALVFGVAFAAGWYAATH